MFFSHFDTRACCTPFTSLVMAGSPATLLYSHHAAQASVTCSRCCPPIGMRLESSTIASRAQTSNSVRSCTDACLTSLCIHSGREWWSSVRSGRAGSPSRAPSSAEKVALRWAVEHEEVFAHRRVDLRVLLVMEQPEPLGHRGVVQANVGSELLDITTVATIGSLIPGMPFSLKCMYVPVPPVTPFSMAPSRSALPNEAPPTSSQNAIAP